MKDELKSGKNMKKTNSLQGQNISKLSNQRIIQKHLVYVIGLSSYLANKDVSRFGYKLIFNCNIYIRC